MTANGAWKKGNEEDKSGFIRIKIQKIRFAGLLFYDHSADMQEKISEGQVIPFFIV